MLALAALAGCWEEPLPAPWPRAAAPLPLSPRILTEVREVGHVTDLRLEDGTLLVAGTCGVARVDAATWSVRSTARYPLPCPPWLGARFHDVDGDGRVEIARFEEGWVGPTAVLELDGSVRWQNALPMRAQGPLDVDGDGRLEFLVGEPNEDGVVLLDHAGNARWRRPWGSSQNGVAVADVDGDGGRELLYADGDAIQVCSAAGERIRSVATPLPGYVNRLEAVDGLPSFPDARLLVGAYVKQRGRQYGWAYTEELEPLGEVALGETHFEEAYRSRAPIGTDPPLWLAVFRETHQAAVAGFEATWLRVALFDERGACAFEQAFPGDEEATPGRGAHVVVSAQPLRLLVGYGPTLWELVE